jgi:hypothetical protein
MRPPVPALDQANKSVVCPRKLFRSQRENRSGNRLMGVGDLRHACLIFQQFTELRHCLADALLVRLAQSGGESVLQQRLKP